MSTQHTLNTTADSTSAKGKPRYSEFLVVVVVVAIATFLLIGTINMQVPEGTGSPGPKFFPFIVTGLLYFLAILLSVSILRATSETAHVAQPEYSQDLLEDLGAIDSTSELRILVDEHSVSAEHKSHRGLDWLTVGKVLAALIIFIVILNPVGWILSAAFLFWTISWALGSKRAVFDVGVSLMFASCIQLAFVAGLGLTLPAGVFGGLF